MIVPRVAINEENPVPMFCGDTRLDLVSSRYAVENPCITLDSDGMTVVSCRSVYGFELSLQGSSGAFA